MINLNNTLIIKYLFRYILILTGLFMLFGYIWLRFIRERLPKDIPFALSFIGFIFLLYICILYTYIIYSLISKTHSTNMIIKKLIDLIYKPLETLDQSIKLHTYIYPYYKRFITSFPDNFGYLFKNPYYFYYIFVIIPRVILITILFIDIFYFHYLSNIYKILLLFVFILFNRYIKYSLNFEKEQIILEWELLLDNITTPYVQGIHPSEIEGHPDYQDPNDPDYDDDIPPTMCLPLRIYIDFQCKYIVHKNYIFDGVIYSTDKYKTIFFEKYNIIEEEFYTTKLYDNVYNEEKKEDLNRIMKIPLLVEYHNYAHNYDPYIRKLRILIYMNYLLCWLYVLILSYPTLPNNTIIDKIELISNSIILSTMFISLFFVIGIYEITYKMSQIISIMKEDMGTKEELDKITWVYMMITIIIITTIVS